MIYQLRTIVLLTALLAAGLGSTAAAKEKTPTAFWTSAGETVGKKTWKVYKPAPKELQEHGFFIRTTLTEQEQSLEAKDILAKLFLEFGSDLRILGQKKVELDGSKGFLMSFQVIIDERKVMGRAVTCETPTGVEVFLLLRRPVSSRKLKTEFDEVWQNWSQNSPVQSDRAAP